MAQELDGPLNAAALAAFRRSLDGDVIATDDLEYDAARAVWNGIVDRRPALVARCTDAADVIKAVRFAGEQDLVIAVRAGGHSVGGFSTCDGGIIIDLSRMREVSVDPQARFARVDGGALGGDLDREAQAFGLACPLGYVRSHRRRRARARRRDGTPSAQARAHDR